MIFKNFFISNLCSFFQLSSFSDIHGKIISFTANVFFYDAKGKDIEATVKGMTEILKAKGLLEVGDTFVTTLSVPSNRDFKTNTVQLGRVE